MSDMGQKRGYEIEIPDGGTLPGTPNPVASSQARRVPVQPPSAKPKPKPKPGDPRVVKEVIKKLRDASAPVFESLGINKP